MTFTPLLALAVAGLSPAAPLAQAPPVAAPAPAPADKSLVRIVLTTAEGPITLALDPVHAPLGTANFLRYVDAKRLDGITFYRAMKMPWGGGLIQGGVRDPRLLYPPIAHEPTTQTGLHHDDGAVSMARNAPGSAQADFFIISGDMRGLDADPARPGDNLGYAVFGHVVAGMDIVRRTLDAPTDPDAGEGAMKGQMLAAPLTVLKAARAAD